MKNKTRQLAILVLGMFFLTLGFSIIMPILPYYTQRMGASALDLGLLMASYSVMQLIVTPYWGEMSDRIGRKPVFLIGLFGYGLSFIIYGFATQLWMLFAARMLGGLLSGGIYPASLAYIADVTEHSERGKAMGMLGAASGLGMVFGPSISGILSVWGLNVPFLVTALAAFVFGAFGYVFLEESRAVDVHHPMRREKVSLLAPMRSPMAILFIMMLLVTFIFSGFQTIFAYYMGGRFGLFDSPAAMPALDGSITLTGPAAMALLFTVMGIVGILCQGVFVGHLISLFGESRTALAGLATAACGFIFINFAGELVSIMFFSSLIAIGVGLAMPCLNSLVSNATEEERQGAMLGVLGSYGALGRIAGPPVGGYSFDFNVYLPYFLYGTLSAAGAVAIFIVLKSRKKYLNR
jgi:DHA1 family multidrug resistance protein-like MFS transporter